MKSITTGFTSVLAIAVLSSGIALAGHHEDDKSQDIVATAKAAGNFTTLLTAVEAAGLVETLQGEGPFTLFAPTDAAFDAVPDEQLEALLADREQLTKVLTYHVVSGRVMAADVVQLSSATSVEGSEIPVRVDGENVTVAGANVVQTDIAASNGVIHVIDEVILP